MCAERMESDLCIWHRKHLRTSVSSSLKIVDVFVLNQNNDLTWQNKRMITFKIP